MRPHRPSARRAGRRPCAAGRALAATVRFALVTLLLDACVVGPRARPAVGPIVAPAPSPSAPGPAARPPVLRVRPFITDDARVVGGGLAQVESWTRVDRETSQLWALGALGPRSWLELTLGGVVGAERGEVAAKEPTPGRLTYALPLLQGKALVRPYAAGRGPGLAFVGGTFLPGGRGFLQLPGHGTFGYAAVSQALARDWRATPQAPDPPLLHVNVGVNRLWIGGERDQTVATWGIGTQAHVARGAHLVAEVFSGDPYVPGSGTAWQAGVRHFVSERLQLDGTVGRGIGGAVLLPPWWSLGVRVVLGDPGAHHPPARP